LGEGDGWVSKKNENKFTLSYKSKNKIKSVNIKPGKILTLDYKNLKTTNYF